MTDLMPLPEESPHYEQGYYECLADTDKIRQGQRVYLLWTTETTVIVVGGDHKYWLDHATFHANFRYDREGLAYRQAEMSALLSEIASLQKEGRESNAQLRDFSPHVGANGEMADTALVPTGSSAMEAKKALAQVRNHAARFRLDLEAKQQALKAMAEEQAIILRAQMDELQQVLSNAEEAIWTINLYLGEDEQIVRLTEGATAPPATPITIRQAVLFMDEEAAIAAEEGGIDFQQIDLFDQWLTENPRHLAQVFPESKGMVALKPRRNPKDYHGDPWADAAMNKENRRTYFLLRNGDNLYRMWTDFDAGERLIPRTDEFAAFFRRSRFNWDTRQEEEEQLRPGSREFMEAEKKADKRQRHYMRVALILQGLIDRTPIFRPLAEPVDVTNLDAYGRTLRVVLDADALLSDGRERFRDWLKRVNATLDVGMRIVGAFNSYDHGLNQSRRERDGGNYRLRPARAAFPRSDKLYTITGEETKSHALFFHYEREGEWQEYQRRATCFVKRDDRFILNFDAATVEEMEFYLRSRLDRQEYTYLFPVLKLAISLKREEVAAEAPFSLLLASQISGRYHVSVEEAQEAVQELVPWWKLKNHTHRALTSDDSKAFRMIVAEYGHRSQRAVEREVLTCADPDAFVATVLEAEPDALLIAHKRAGEYVVLVPANRGRVFPDNAWIGVTCTSGYPLGFDDLNKQRFYSLEPLHGPIGFIPRCEWVIVGAETNGPKFSRPKREWVQEIVDRCRGQSIPVFLKDSLAPYWNGPLPQEFPEVRA